MNKLLIMLLFGLFISLNGYSQTIPREVNENYMQTVFFEDFLGTQLDRYQWDVTTFKRGLGVLADDPQTIQVLEGNLKLNMIYSPNYTSGGYTGDYVGGEISTKISYNYGSFECRAKFAHQLASQPAFWLLGDDGLPCPPGGYGNEIDIAELKCEDSSPLSIDHVIHRYYPLADCSGSYHVQKNLHEYFGMSFDDNFHIFKCVWTPYNIDYYVDGIRTHQVFNSGQEWYPNLFLYPILSQQILDPIGAPIAPQTSYFDYVRVKQFFLAPVITGPNCICSTGVETLDVVAEAKNIIWQLTPASLFTTSTGIGKTANIIRASGAIGVGKITYTFQMPSGETFTSFKDIYVGSLPTPVILGNHTVKCGGTGITFKLDASNTTGGETFLWDSDILAITGSDAGSQCEITMEPPSASGSISCTVTACGVSKTGTFYINLICKSELLLLISPNPSTNETKVELVSENGETLAEDIEWSLDVYDQAQNLKANIPKARAIKQTINTSGWKDGVYIIRAIIGEKIISEQLVVKH